MVKGEDEIGAINKERVKKQFNRSATRYDDLAVVQKKMAQAIMDALDERAIRPRRILEIGCGTGALTRRMADRFPDAKITAIDIAEEMVETAKNSVPPHSNIRFMVQDAEEVQFPGGAFDLIVSNATIQWLEKPLDFFGRGKPWLADGGWIIATTFGPETFAELNHAFAVVKGDLGISLGTHGLRYDSRSEWEMAMRTVGFERILVNEKHDRMRYPDCRRFLESVKSIGASYSDHSLDVSTLRRLMPQMMAFYDRAFRAPSGKGVIATYHWMVLVAQKKRSC